MNSMTRVSPACAGALIAVVAVAMMSGCATFGDLVGLASEEYVDERIAEVQAEMSGLSGEIEDNRSKIAQANSRLEDISVAADEVAHALESMESAVRTTEELKQLAVVLEERLADLPEQTIQQLVEVLQAYLDR
jgi:septal ring factor EnvC (AmiA/AmiB activator)